MAVSTRGVPQSLGRAWPGALPFRADSMGLTLAWLFVFTLHIRCPHAAATGTGQESNRQGRWIQELAAFPFCFVFINTQVGAEQSGAELARHGHGTAPEQRHPAPGGHSQPKGDKLVPNGNTGERPPALKAEQLSSGWLPLWIPQPGGELVTRSRDVSAALQRCSR